MIHHPVDVVIEADGTGERGRAVASSWVPLMERSKVAGEAPVRLGHDLVDAYLRFVWARARHNTLLAVGFDLKVFFTVVAKNPSEVTTADVLEFKGDVIVVELTREEQRIANKAQDTIDSAAAQLAQAGQQTAEAIQPAVTDAAKELKSSAHDSVESVKGDAQHAADDIKDSAQNQAEQVREP